MPIHKPYGCYVLKQLLLCGVDAVSILANTGRDSLFCYTTPKYSQTMKENQLVAAQSMSSLQIAEITGKRHDAILRDIRALLEQGVAAHNFVETSYTDKSNRQSPCFNLTKKGCLILASGYNALLREKIIDRWEELETEKANGGFKVPQSYSEALALAAEQQKQIEQKDKTIAKLQPKADFADAAFSSDTLISISQAAKILRLGFGRNTLFKKLREKGVFFTNRNEPKQKYVDAKYFNLVEGKPIPRSNGSILIPVTVYCTQKGLAYINHLFGSGKRAALQIATVAGKEVTL